MIKKISIAGMGWLGQPLAVHLINSGFFIKGSVTTPEKSNLLNQHGFPTFIVEIAEKGISGDVDAFLEDTDCLVIMIPPGLRRNTGSDFVLKMAHFREEIKKHTIGKVILVSSASVYADKQGAVTEIIIPRPDTMAGKQLRQVEELFENTKSFKASIVRFGGLIGGKRQPARFLAGRKDLHDGEAPVNLIHRKDCIDILVQIIAQDAFGHVFNAVNPKHPTKREYYMQKCLDLDLIPPSFAPAIPGEIHKQVDSVNLGAILDFSFKHSI